MEKALDCNGEVIDVGDIVERVMNEHCNMKVGHTATVTRTEKHRSGTFTLYFQEYMSGHSAYKMKIIKKLTSESNSILINCL